MGFRKTLTGIAAAAMFTLGGATASKAIVTEAIVLGIDASGSIGAANFTLQKNAYVNVLGNVIPIDGSVAIGVVKFSTNVTTVLGMTIVNNAGDLTTITNAINGMSFDNGQTDLAGAIEVSANLLDAFDNIHTGARTIIDISTDGDQFLTVQGSASSSGNPVTEGNEAIALGIDQVNCIGIGGSANCGFIAGTGAFSVSASTFADFEDALEDKIIRELQIPEPGMVAIFGLGLLGLAAIRRRRTV